MDTNDFIGSFAQENVAFTTRVVRTTRVGDIYWKAMIFVENSRFVDSSDAAWTTVPGSVTIKALTVTADDYATYTSGLLKSWLYDLFCNGFTGDCILVACGPNVDPEGDPAVTAAEFIENMTTAYELMKAYAYHKTVLAGSATIDATYASIAVELCKLCAADKGLLSSAPYLPYTTSTPETTSSDVVYAAVSAASADAFMSAYQDATRNAALYSLGLAMSILNGSGTCVGNSMDMIKSNNIASSGAEGTGLTKPIRAILTAANIQSFKPVGDNSGNVAAIGAKTLKGDVVQATWIIAYITYMVKVEVARMITVPNFLKNADSYSQILGIMSNYLSKFGSSGSGRLDKISVTAPGFGALPEAKDDVIIVPDAWSATYVDQVREVQITGTLYIGA